MTFRILPVVALVGLTACAAQIPDSNPAIGVGFSDYDAYATERARRDAELQAMADLDNDDFEFVEVINTSDVPLALSGAHFTEGVQFTFPAEQLAADERAVIVRDSAAFQLPVWPAAWQH